MNVLLINDSSSNPNWGDRAAAIALKRMIADCGGTLSGVVTEDDLRDGRYFQPPVEEAWPPEPEARSFKDWVRLLLPPVVLKVGEKVLQRLATGAPDPIPLTVDGFEAAADAVLRDMATFGGLLDAIERSDVTVIHGDGAMVGNGLMPRTELFFAYLVKTRFRKPVILINHTTDFNHPNLDRMAAAVYPLLDDVTYRDQTSEKLCQGRWPGRYSADTAFKFAPAEREAWSALAARPTYFDIWPDEAAFDPAKPYICIGGSSIYSFDGPVRDYVAGFATLARHLYTIYPGQVVLTASDFKDQMLLRPVARELGLPLVGLTIPVQQAVDIIGHAEAYVGGRWHPAIFALRGGAPVIPLSSKTFKVPALIAMTGLPVPTFNALDLTGETEGIGRTLTDLLQQGDGLRRQLRQWAQLQADGCWDNLAFLQQLAGGTRTVGDQS